MQLDTYSKDHLISNSQWDGLVKRTLLPLPLVSFPTAFDAALKVDGSSLHSQSAVPKTRAALNPAEPVRTLRSSRLNVRPASAVTVSTTDQRQPRLVRSLSRRGSQQRSHDVSGNSGLVVHGISLQVEPRNLAGAVGRRSTSAVTGRQMDTQMTGDHISDQRTSSFVTSFVMADNTAPSVPSVAHRPMEIHRPVAPVVAHSSLSPAHVTSAQPVAWPSSGQPRPMQFERESARPIEPLSFPPIPAAVSFPRIDMVLAMRARRRKQTSVSDTVPAAATAAVSVGAPVAPVPTTIAPPVTQRLHASVMSTEARAAILIGCCQRISQRHQVRTVLAFAIRRFSRYIVCFIYRSCSYVMRCSVGYRTLLTF